MAAPTSGPLRRLGWFVAIYTASVLALGTVSLVIRWWLKT